MRKTLIQGLVIGLLGGFLLLSYTYWKSSQVIIDDKKDWVLSVLQEKENTALQSIALPPEGLGVLLAKLGYRNFEEAKPALAEFRARIEAGVLPTNWNQECEKKHTPSLCLTLREYFDYYEQNSARKSTSGKIGPRVQYLRIHQKLSAKDIVTLQGEEFGILWRRMPDWSLKNYQDHKKAILGVQSCPRFFSLVAARELEKHLPNLEALNLMFEFDEHGLACLSENDPNAEFLFFRIGLFHYLGAKSDKDLRFAYELFKKASLVGTKKEEYRTLYWRWKLAKMIQHKEDALKTLADLTTRYPASFYSLLALVEEGIDPLQLVRKNRLQKDEYEARDHTLNRRLTWLKLLLHDPQAEFASSRYSAYVAMQLKNTTESVGVIQHLARLYHVTGLHRLQIYLLAQLIADRPSALSLEILRLMYPLPFFKEFDRSTDQIDTTLLLGLARQESGFDPRARSSANAQGILQLLPSTAKMLVREVGLKDKELYDFSHNIQLGSRYLLKRVGNFDGSVEKAMAAYNAGESVVRSWNGYFSNIKDPLVFSDLVPYRETRDYVPLILRNAYWYHRLYPKFTQDLKKKRVSSALLSRVLLPQSE